MSAPFIRSPYNYDVVQASDDAAYVETMPSLTVQSMSEDADINVMMQRFGVVSNFPAESFRAPRFGDFSGINDFQSALEAVLDAEEEFLKVPAAVRARFENNPQKLLEFVSNDANMDEARKLGLLKEKVGEIPVRESRQNAGGEVKPPGGGAVGNAPPVGAGEGAA